MKKAICILMTSILLVMLAVPAMAAVNIRGIQGGDLLYVDTQNGGGLNVREAGSSNAAIIKKVPNASCVIAGDEYNGNYLLVTIIGAGSNPDTIGWVDMRYLSVNPPKGSSSSDTSTDETVKSLNFRSYKFPQGYLYVAARPSRVGGYVNLRWVPSTEGAVIEKMYAGEEMEVITEGKTWYQVKCADGYVGFIMKKFTEVIYYSLEPR